jgi:hypothetical protein
MTQHKTKLDFLEDRDDFKPAVPGLQTTTKRFKQTSNIGARALPALHTSDSLHFLKQQNRKTRSRLLRGAISYFYARLFSYLIALNSQPYEDGVLSTFLLFQNLPRAAHGQI